MASVKNSDEDLGKVFAVRRSPRRPTEIWRTQSSSSVTDWHEADSSISADINLPLQVLLPPNCSAVHPDSVTSEPGLDVSTNGDVSSARYSCGVSSSREVSDPGTMPLAGSSMEVAIARLLTILQAIYVRAYSIMGTRLNFKGRQTETRSAQGRSGSFDVTTPSTIKLVFMEHHDRPGFIG